MTSEANGGNPAAAIAAGSAGAVSTTTSIGNVSSPRMQPGRSPARSASAAWATCGPRCAKTSALTPVSRKPSRIVNGSTAIRISALAYGSAATGGPAGPSAAKRTAPVRNPPKDGSGSTGPGRSQNLRQDRCLDVHLSAITGNRRPVGVGSEPQFGLRTAGGGGPSRQSVHLPQS